MTVDAGAVSWFHAAGALSWSGPPRRPRPPRRGAPPAPRDGHRRAASVRAFATQLPELAVVEGLLRAAYGADPDGHRRVPSAGGLYALRHYVLATPSGRPVCRFEDTGRLVALPGPDTAPGAAPASVFNQLRGAAWLVASLVDPAPYVARYGIRGYRYALIEVGHAGQELLRAAGRAGLGSCPLGAFDDDAVLRITGTVATGWLPAYLVAVGAEPEGDDG